MYNNYNRNKSKNRLQIPSLSQYIEIVAKYESPNVNFGGEVKIKYSQPLWCGMCEWTVRKDINLIDGNSGVPVKYIDNIRVRIPYLDLFKTKDYFVITKPDNIYYKIMKITDEENTKKWLTLELQQWK